MESFEALLDRDKYDFLAGAVAYIQAIQGNEEPPTLTWAWLGKNCDFLRIIASVDTGEDLESILPDAIYDDMKYQIEQAKLLASEPSSSARERHDVGHSMREGDNKTPSPTTDDHRHNVLIIPNTVIPDSSQQDNDASSPAENEHMAGNDDDDDDFIVPNTMPPPSNQQMGSRYGSYRTNAPNDEDEGEITGGKRVRTDYGTEESHPKRRMTDTRTVDDVNSEPRSDISEERHRTTRYNIFSSAYNGSSDEEALNTAYEDMDFDQGP